MADHNVLPDEGILIIASVFHVHTVVYIPGAVLSVLVYILYGLWLVPGVKKDMDDLGQPLFVTPFLEAGKADEARDLALVEPFLGDIESYAGFFTIDETHESNYFFWFFPAAENPEKAPVVLWLEGGPGLTTLYGLFGEHGPYGVKEDGETLYLRDYAWTKTFSMLYVDYPVGTGYSFTKNNEGFCKNGEEVDEHLYRTLLQFFQLFPKLLANEFYVFGESYGGKVAPSLARTIHKRNEVSSTKINLVGIAVSAGFCDPIRMLDYGEMLYNVGLIDLFGKEIVDKHMNKVQKFMREGKFSEAFDMWYSFLVNGDTPGVFTSVTGYQNYANYLISGLYDDKAVTVGNLPFIRQKIHVGSSTFQNGQDVKLHLKADVLKSVVRAIKVVLDNRYKYIMYSGQVDIITAYQFVLEYLAQIEWYGAEKLKNAERHVWKVDPEDVEIAGYVRSVDNFFEVMVRNCGHMVAVEQPRTAYDIVQRFVFNKPFN